MLRHREPLSRSSRWLLLAGALSIAVALVAMGFTQATRWLVFFDNLHWTVSELVAAALAWLRVTQLKLEDRKGLRWIAWGLTAYAFGQVLWDIQVSVGYTPFPAPSDLFFLLLGPCVVAAQLIEIRGHTALAQRQMVWLDSCIVTVAMSALVLLVYLPKRGDTTLWPLLVLIAYPATLLAALSVTLIMVPVLRLRLGLGLLLFLAGLLLNALSWMNWNAKALDASNLEGNWVNVSFSVGSLLMGYSLTQWRLERNTDRAWDRRCEGILRQLPLVAVVVAALTVVLSHTAYTLAPGNQVIVDFGGVIVIFLAMSRQGAMLRERDQLLQTQQALLTSQRALAQERGLLKSLIGTIPDLVWMKDPAGHYLACNTRFEQFFGARESAILGKTDYDFVDAKLADFFRENDRIATLAGGPSVNDEWLTFAVGGYHGLFETTKTPAFDEHGQLLGVLGIARDITERQQAQEQLRIAAAAFESVEGMMVTDANKVILSVNQAFTHSTGYSAEEAVGQTPDLLETDRHAPAFYQAMWDAVQQTGGWQGEVWSRRKNGEIYPKWLTLSAVRNEHGEVTHYIGSHHDITERKHSEGRINELAFFDQLTGLPNRTLLLDRLRQNVAANCRDGSYGALLFIDLDNFKVINDTLGHDTGDQLLKQVGQRLLQCVREADTVARLGGDEFVVMLAGLATREQDAAARTELVAEKILASLGQSYLLKSITHHCTGSIGATVYGDENTEIDELLKQADLAMYRSKEAGRNTVRFFDPAMEAAVMERAGLEADLRRALEERQFLLYYQAQVTGDGRITGAEVLARWPHPGRGMVSPLTFIPIAEDTGLILALGQWVLETACRQLAAWSLRPEFADLTVAVNVSASQFRQHDFVDQVLAVLNRTGANPRQLKLELTESLLVSNVDEVIEKMFELKAKGVGFALDDFGTGFSSLTYLKRMPLDQLKIDQSFVRDVLTDANDAAIAKTIIALAQSLGLGVIAEGVETAAQRDFLAVAGCHAYQGYFFNRPLALAGFEAFVLQSHRDNLNFSV